MALRRADLTGKGDPFANILEFIDPKKYLLLPNTSGAMNAEEAVRLAKAFRPTVVFLDLGMPKIDGYGAARLIRKLDPRVILIALSGWGTEEDRRRSADAGFDLHLVKPIAPTTLEAVLAGLRRTPA